MRQIIYTAALSALLATPVFSQPANPPEDTQKRLQQVELTVREFASVSSHLGILQVIVGLLGGLIGIVGLSLPLAIYFFQLRPAQEALAKLDDFDKKLEEKLIAYLKREEQKRVNKAIDEVVSPSETVAYNAVQYLSFNQFYDFSDDQLFKLCTHLRTGIDNQKKGMLALILAKRQTPFADQFFRDAIQSRDYGTLLYPALTYFARVGIETYLPDIATFIRTANNAAQNPMTIGSNYSNVVVNIVNISPRACEALINSVDLNNGLDPQIRRQVVNSLQGVAQHYGIQSAIASSLLSRGL